jgi:hypothetical protein
MSIYYLESEGLTTTCQCMAIFIPPMFHSGTHPTPPCPHDLWARNAPLPHKPVACSCGSLWWGWFEGRVGMGGPR